jgi:ribosome-binding factor A
VDKIASSDAPLAMTDSYMKPIKKDTNRIAKVNSLIQHELGPVLNEFLDWQKGLVTITKVETSKDMKYAKIWISIFNPDPLTQKNEIGIPAPIRKDGKSLIRANKKKPAVPSLDDKILKFLADNIYDLQGEVNKHFHTKVIPRISFHLDTSPRYVQHIDEVLRKIHEEQ